MGILENSQPIHGRGQDAVQYELTNPESVRARGWEDTSLVICSYTEPLLCCSQDRRRRRRIRMGRCNARLGWGDSKTY